MKTVNFSGKRGEPLHIEAPGCIVNIRCTYDADGVAVTAVEILPDRYVGEEWHLPDFTGSALNVRVKQGARPVKTRKPKADYRVWRVGVPLNAYASRDESFLAAAAAFTALPDQGNPKAWEYVQVVKKSAYQTASFGTAGGATGWRHKESGIVIPDVATQTGKQADFWGRTRQHNLSIAPNSPIIQYLG